MLILLLHHLLLLEELLLRQVDLLHVVLLHLGQRQLVLYHGDDELDLVDLGVEGLGVPGAFAELLQELDAFHL